METFQQSICSAEQGRRMFCFLQEWPLWLILTHIKLTSTMDKRSFRYWGIQYVRDIANVVQPSTCNTYKAIEQANSSRPHLDVTGIGATACCHGFFVPNSVVDFQKGERCVRSIKISGRR
jgi:Kyakuja-Dileera-Zisupton transposase